MRFALVDKDRQVAQKISIYDAGGGSMRLLEIAGPNAVLAIHISGRHKWFLSI